MERSVTGDVLKEVLKQLDALIEKGQEVLKSLTDILDSGGKSIITKIVNGIQNIIDDAQKVLLSAGDCGINQLDNLINLGKSETEAAVNCVGATLSVVPEVIINYFSNIYLFFIFNDIDERRRYTRRCIP